MIRRLVLSLLVPALVPFCAHASSFWSTDSSANPASAPAASRAGSAATRSAAVFRGYVTATESFLGSDGGIYTRATIRVAESFKGKLPDTVSLVHRGGTVGHLGESDGFNPQLKSGEQRVFLVSRRTDGTLFATEGFRSALLVSSPSKTTGGDTAVGDALLAEFRSITASGMLNGADLSDQAAPVSSASSSPAGPVGPSAPTSAATNLITGGDGIPARHLLPDRGEGIPYLIDADYLPAGMTQTQAVTAVQTALAAWTNVCSARYKFLGTQSFLQASANITNNDGILRIQLHDHWNYIGGGGGSGDTLGVGGQHWLILNTSLGWTLGGNVRGNDFHQTSNPYVVLAHTNTFMQNLTNFTEVLAHEIGHSIGLNHSSQNQFESNPILKQAIMYYLAHGDGRGATLNSFDSNVSQQIHPTNNTPPYCYSRFIDAVTGSSSFAAPGVNTVQVRGYDLQNSSLTFATTDASANTGSFSVSGTNITYIAPLAYNGPWSDPSGGSFYDVIAFRFSDGVNAAPYGQVGVVSLNPDSYAEGIPNSWRTTYFLTASPGTAGSNHHWNDDPDADGYNNVTEWRLGSVPTNKVSNLKITSFSANNLQFQAKPYELYELQCTTNFTTWTRALNPIMPTNNPAVVTGFTNGSPRQFYRVVKIP